MTLIRCYDNKLLRRIVSKRLTADSLVITYQEQRRHEEFGYTGYCSVPAQVTYSPITVNQWRLARTGNQWPTATVAGVPLAVLRLLTGEYVAGTVLGPGSSAYLLAGLPISSGGFSSCPSTIQDRISYTPYYLQLGNANPPTYQMGVDYAAWQFGFGPGVTTTAEGPTLMGSIYYRKTVNGVTQICGSPLAFVNLLSTRAAQAASVATLHPNPAAEAATLTLAASARPGSILRLTDALGRLVWSNSVPVGQTTVAVPLAGHPAGLYLLHLNNAEGTVATWKLNHE
jgi:hypothetical protein